MADTASARGSSSSSKSLLWMMLALFGGVAILLGGGLFLGSRLINALRMQDSGNKATVHTPAGDIRVQKPGEGSSGMPVYPHASLVLPREGATPQPPESGDFEVHATSYFTTDSRLLVEEWYGQHLSADFVRHGTQASPLPDQYKDLRISKDDVAFAAEHGNQLRVVVLIEENDGTSIRIFHLAKREPQ